MFESGIGILDILLIICVVVLIVLVVICVFKKISNSNTTSTFKAFTEPFKSAANNKLNYVSQWFRAISGCVENQSS